MCALDSPSRPTASPPKSGERPPRLEMTTPISTKFEDVRFSCSACGKEFKYVAPYGASRGWSRRAQATYLTTRFRKHVLHHHGPA
jgi:hypothetical protein